VRHYQGHPKDTTTIYIDSREANVERITELVHQILKELQVPTEALRWERRDDPDL
jgi:type IV secretory pathway ATPase VirB11/archaellum biosynthesis ATPase